MTDEENEYLCRIGPSTPTGNLLRRYWLPALLSEDLAGPDSTPVRVRLLGEDLIAFRDTDGRIGLLDAHCAHRGASLFFGRNEECGLRCVYHGWKYDVQGNCVDMPNEPAESNFKHKVRLTTYPTVEAAGMIWTYMGPADKQPPFREFPFHFLPQAQWAASRAPVFCNYMQVNEGNIDSSHVGFLHRDFASEEPVHDGTDRPGYPSQKLSGHLLATSLAVRIELEETPYGFRYAAVRTTPAGHQHVRLTQQVLPNITFIAGSLPTRGLDALIIVPIDDEQSWLYHAAFGRVTNVVDDQGRRTRTPENDYLIDRVMQRTVNFTGILGTGNQDRAVIESMGAVYNRRNEHLGTTDLAIITLRQILIRAARNLEQGIDPPALDPAIPFHRVRPEDKIIPAGADWRDLATDADPDYHELVPEGKPVLAGAL